MKFQSINPYNGKVISEFTSLTEDELNQKLSDSASAFKDWSKQPLSHRTNLIKKAGQILRENVDEYAETITLD